MRGHKITELKGIGAKTGELFARLGVRTTEDMIHFYPRAYDEYKAPVTLRELIPDTQAAVRITLKKDPDLLRYGKLPVTSINVQEDGISLSVVWFNMPWLKKQLPAGNTFVFRGHIAKKRGRLTLEQPEIFTEEQYRSKEGTLQPIYPQTKGLGNKTIAKTVQQIFETRDLSREYLPESLRSRYGLAEYNFAIDRIHFPENRDELMYARKRLVFDEFFLFTLSARFLKEKKEDVMSRNRFRITGTAQRVLDLLPYELTGAQKKVLNEIFRDLTGGRVMKRLVQGDVGSGKTIIAVLALLECASNGYQGALMAPTEVLAKQHFESVTELLRTYDIHFTPVLLTGSMKAKEKRETLEKIRNHEADLIIGTHALISENVKYDRLALVITDEQHRFGVNQRAVLEEKGTEPHVMVMSATPIPRTLAIILYGDLDISVINELPAKRLPIRNAVVGTDYRPNAWRFIAKEVQKGHQAYVICPMVEPGEMQDLENVLDYSEKLTAEYQGSGIRVAFLHGQMKTEEKNRIMDAFAAGEIHVLVSTTVIEVGINVPNATVMMIEDAERFGLAQLHQLRGRVGRGDAQSYCIMVNGSGDEHAGKRLEILKKSDDGFYIAEEDLKLRGPGDLFGVRQSGELEFRLGDIYTDAEVLKTAAAEARDLLERDPKLEKEENADLKRMLDGYLEDKFREINL